MKLNLKVEEALARGWNEWSAQATKLQIRVYVENQKKEGHGFFKMDENNIQVLREDLIEEFQALAQMHTTTIGTPFLWNSMKINSFSPSKWMDTNASASNREGRNGLYTRSNRSLARESNIGAVQ